MLRLETATEFWEASLEGTKLTRRFGRVGAKGRTAARSFPTGIAARHGLEDELEARLATGYVIKEDRRPTPEREPINTGMDARLGHEPPHPNTAFVYADWLQTRGHPRGELMMMQHAMLEARGPELRRFRDELARLLRTHADVFLGPITEVDNLFE